MQLLDWLVVATVGAIVLVLLDGFRRKWSERRNRVVVKLDRNIPAEDINPDELPNSELPNGGARTLPRAHEPPPRRRSFNLKDGRDRRQQEPEPEVPATVAQAVPVLMDPVDIEETEIEHANVFVTVDTTVSDVDGFAEDELPPEVLAGLDRAFGDTATDEASESGDEDEEGQSIDASALMDELADQFVATEPDPLLQGYADDSDDADDVVDDAVAALPDVIDELEDEVGDNDADEEIIDGLDEELGEEPGEEGQEPEHEERDDAARATAQDQTDDDIYTGEEDYESEPALLENAYRRAASHFQRPPPPAEPRIEPGFGEGQSPEEVEPTEQMMVSLDEQGMAAFLDEEQEEIRAWRNQSVTQQAVPASAVPPPAPAIPPTPQPARQPAVQQPSVQPAAARVAPVPAPAPAATTIAATPPPISRVSPTIVMPDEEHEPEFESAPQAAPAPTRAQPAKADSKPRFWETMAGKAVSNVSKVAARVAPARANQGELFQEEPAPAQDPVPEPEPAPQEVIIVNVMAKSGQYFYGDELLPVLQHFGLRLGSMNIFHRHTEMDGNGPVMFSMANMVKPGTFSLAAMSELVTPGVSFFVQLPNRHGNMKSFEQMLATANAVKQALDGDLKDERRSVLTRQTVEHCRQRIRDFELSQLSRK